MSIETDVAVRLWAIKAVCGIRTNPELAKICETTPSAVNNWLRGYNLPRVPEMILLCERAGVTLDWLYRGFTASMDPRFSLRLAAYIKENPLIPS
jgi:transcriptional regulator with XRE-family HTH domain